MSFFWNATVGSWPLGESGEPGPLFVRRAEGALRQLHHALVVDVPGGRHDHVRSHVVGVVPGRDVGHRYRGHHLGPPDDRPPEGVVAEDRAGEHVVDLVLRLVLVHRDLLDHHLALGVDVRVRRAQHHVLEQVVGASQVAVEEAA